MSNPTAVTDAVHKRLAEIVETLDGSNEQLRYSEEAVATAKRRMLSYKEEMAELMDALRTSPDSDSVSFSYGDTFFKAKGFLTWMRMNNPDPS